MILYFDRRMSELMDSDETIMIVMRGIEFLRIDTEHTGKSSFSHFPDMDIFDRTLSISFYLLCDFFYDLSICGPIYEDSRCISHEKVCPSEYEYCAEYSHTRIEPVPAKILCSEKRKYSKNRCKSIRYDMEVCRLKIEIFMILMMIMTIVFVMSMIMIMILTVSEYEGADYIHDKTRNRDYKSYIVVYSKRRYESLYRKTSYN